MSKLNYTPSEFADLLVAILYDKSRNPDEIIIGNKEFNEFFDVLYRRGLKSLTQNYYINMDGNRKADYRRIRNVFTPNNSGKHLIALYGENVETEDGSKKGSSIVKNLVKKTLGLLKQERLRTGRPINEEKLEKIINYVVENEEDF